jgi:hypothetical protein
MTGRVFALHPHSSTGIALVAILGCRVRSPVRTIGVKPNLPQKT